MVGLAETKRANESKEQRASRELFSSRRRGRTQQLGWGEQGKNGREEDDDEEQDRWDKVNKRRREREREGAQGKSEGVDEGGLARYTVV